MGIVKLDISVSVDGFAAGPRATDEQPLGEGGDRLHEWAYELETFRERHGHTGGETNEHDRLVRETYDTTGAFVMGRRMFDGREGPWGDHPSEGWWGDEPPFHAPVFVVTHHPRETLAKQGGTSFTFVTEGVEAAIEQARAAAGDRDVMVSGGPNVAQQALRAALLDELRLHVAPVLLRDGVRLFEDGVGGGPLGVEAQRVIASPKVTHLLYRVPR